MVARISIPPQILRNIYKIFEKVFSDTDNIQLGKLNSQGKRHLRIVPSLLSADFLQSQFMVGHSLILPEFRKQKSKS